jgi:hypothetical protein
MNLDPSKKPSCSKITTEATCESAGCTWEDAATLPICFSGMNTIHVQGKGMILMKDLEIGDYVDDGNDSFTRVYSFSHLDRKTEASYLQIFATGLEHPLEISPDHYLFVTKKESQSATTTAARARDVQVGDILNNGHAVTQIETIQRHGMYAPVTESGKLVVSGVLASSYVAVLDVSPTWHIAISHAIVSPLNWICNQFNFEICERETYTDGFSNYYYRVIDMGFHIARLTPQLQDICGSMLGTHMDGNIRSESGASA